MESVGRSDKRAGIIPLRFAPLIQRIVDVTPQEIPAMLWAFAYFFCVLCSYYIMRPVRDEMGVTVGQDRLQTLFTIVFVVMLVLVPAFGWVVNRFARSRIVPVVYGFLIVNLVVFWLLFTFQIRNTITAGAFFVWVSVFNLFAVSLFWSVMSDIYDSASAKRLYGFIVAGGSAGAICGPLLTQSLVHAIGPANLLLVAALVLAGAVACMGKLAPLMTAGGAAVGATGQAAVTREGHASQVALLVSGARSVWDSPYLFRIALWVLLANTISTLFYFEQASIVGQALSDRAARVQLFARLDLAVSLLTILIQLGLTSRLMAAFGIGPCIALLPVTAVAGLIALWVAPGLAVIIAIIVVERAVTFAVTSPAARVLFTAVTPEQKYKAQNFIDTVVYRGGDAASGAIFNALTQALGLPISGLALATAPVALAWLWLSFWLGRQLEALIASGGSPPTSNGG